MDTKQKWMFITILGFLDLIFVASISAMMKINIQSGVLSDELNTSPNQLWGTTFGWSNDVIVLLGLVVALLLVTFLLYKAVASLAYKSE